MSLLESKAMLILWKHRTCCVHMIKMELESDKKMAYTTVQTIMERLVNKGMAKKHQVDKTTVYTPAVTKTAYATSLVNICIQQLLTNYEDVLVISLTKGLGQLNKKQLSEVVRNLEA